MKRIQNILLALLTITTSANAQNLSFEVKANEATVNISGATDMTALQFCLQLPAGVTIDTSNATMGEATASHTLCIETLDNGDLLFILYSMDLNTFKDGELLRFPVAASDETVKLYTIRYADTDAVSYVGEDIETGISLTPALSKGEGAIYNVSGQHLNKMERGINIIQFKDGTKKKVLIK